MSRAAVRFRSGVLLLDSGADCGVAMWRGGRRRSPTVPAGRQRPVRNRSLALTPLGVRRGGSGVDGLAVHRFPEGGVPRCRLRRGRSAWPDVGVGLAVGGGRCGGVGDSRGTADGAGEHFGGMPRPCP